VLPKAPTLETGRRDVTDAQATATAEPYHFSITYTEAELRAIGKLIASRRARAENDHTMFGLVFAVPLVIGFAVYVAFTFDLIARDAVPAALGAAFIAYPAGWATYWWLLRRHYRRRRNDQLEPWNYTFGADAISYISENIVVQMKWAAIDAAHDLGRIVLLRFGDQNVFIPARMFADPTARKAFAAFCADRIKAAAKGAQ
jgi:hypothetical protein